MPKRPKAERKGEELNTDALRWEFVRRDPEYRGKYVRLIELDKRLDGQQERGALRQKTLEDYRLFEIADPDRSWKDFRADGPLPTSRRIVEPVVPKSYAKKDKNLHPILRALDGLRFTVSIDMSRKKETIMADFEDAVDEIQKAVKKFGLIDDTRRRIDDWYTCLKVYDLKEQNPMTFDQIAQRLSEKRPDADINADTVRKQYHRAKRLVNGGHRKIR